MHGCNGHVADANSLHEQRQLAGGAYEKGRSRPQRGPFGPCGYGEQWWSTEPDVGRVANGVAARVDRLKAIGNGQVPLCAATAWNILTHRSA
jgi:DNA (cytosine-5)-methyltransferase 1